MKEARAGRNTEHWSREAYERGEPQPDAHEYNEARWLDALTRVEQIDERLGVARGQEQPRDQRPDSAQEIDAEEQDADPAPELGPLESIGERAKGIAGQIAGVLFRALTGEEAPPPMTAKERHEAKLQAFLEREQRAHEESLEAIGERIDRSAEAEQTKTSDRKRENEISL
jgi:hypothetical protein